MKIFTTAQLHELDKYTIEHEPVASIDLMERAARALTTAILDEWTKLTPVIVLAGPGNNGGDALAVARMLADKDFNVSVYLFNVKNQLSDECITNRKRIEDDDRITFTEVSTNFDPPKLTADTLVIDGLFGSGLNKPLAGGFASLVRYINSSPCQVVSIDMPSGMMTEDNTQNNLQTIMRANLTLTIQQKKLCMMFADMQKYIGRLRVIDIRLSQTYIQETATPFVIAEEPDVRRLLRPRSDFAHKGTMGHALLVAGSYGMAGAATLATRACLKAGVGKVTAHIPRRNYDIMQISVPEAIVQLDADDTCFTQTVPTDMFNAVGIGPGLGQDENTAIALFEQIRKTTCPMVLDADALNILGNHGAWMQQLPKGLVLTPHPIEFDRLVGEHSANDYERLDRARSMAAKLEAHIILKGHYSALCTPTGEVLFNATGNAGMATAGSGDVLTGIITALLARGYTQRDTCLLGMYLHGSAGDFAAEALGKESLTASDIIAYLPQAFRSLGA